MSITKYNYHKMKDNYNRLTYDISYAFDGRNKVEKVKMVDKYIK